MESDKLTLIGASGTQIAEITLSSEEDGWLFGTLVSQQLSPQLKEALEWYDEVVENQMLSFLDQAIESVAQFGLCVRAPQGGTRKVYSLQVSKRNEVSFRTSPVPPPALLFKKRTRIIQSFANVCTEQHCRKGANGETELGLPNPASRSSAWFKTHHHGRMAEILHEIPSAPVGKLRKSSPQNTTGKSVKAMPQFANWGEKSACRLLPWREPGRTRPAGNPPLLRAAASSKLRGCVARALARSRLRRFSVWPMPSELWPAADNGP